MKILNPENIDFQCIQNIIFDWGGVITNIDHDISINAFKKLGLDNFHEHFSHSIQNQLFQNFETGNITAREMRGELQKYLNGKVTDSDIDEAWCALLLDTPETNLQILKNLGKQYHLYLLSNTNEIHANYYNKKLKTDYNINFPALFEKVYYSHTVGLRKPGIPIFEYVVNNAGIKPGETLFIDDTEKNIDTASKLGFHAFYMHNGMIMPDLFKNILK
jgi:glucose-1-phosphatase